MNNILRLLLINLLCLCSCQSAWAGAWGLDRYEVLISGVGQTHEFQPQYDQNWERIVGIKDKVQSLQAYSRGRYVSSPHYYVVKVTGGSSGQSVEGSSSLRYQGSQGQQPASWPNFKMNAGKAKVTLTVTPVFTWQSSGDDAPTPEFWIWESGTVGFSHSNSDPFRRYSEQNPYDGTNFSLSEFDLGLDGEVESMSMYHPAPYTGPQLYNGLTGATSVTKPKLINASGRTEVYGATRTLKAEATSEGWMTNDLGRDYYGAAPSAAAHVGVSYRAGVTQFALNVTANVFKSPNNSPHKKELDAYASRNETGGEIFGSSSYTWDGAASYSVYLSQNMRSWISNPITYHWNAGGSWANNSASNDQHSISGVYKFKGSHTLDGAPHTTNARVIVEGDNLESGLLTASAKINWYEAPATKFHIESKVAGIDLETGTEIELSGNDGGLVTAVIEANEEIRTTVGARSQIAGGGQDAVGDFAVFDTSAALTPSETALNRIYRTDLSSAGNVTSTLRQHIIGKGEALKAAARDKLGKGADHPVIIRVRTRAFPTGRVGKLPPHSTREGLLPNLYFGGTDWLGQFCFVAGTLVDTQHGKRAIESLKAGDLVWAKDESTGEIALKPIVQTFERVAPSTLALTFSNGETIETTREHPFYVLDRGFVQAGELGIGTSIVTRAGPTVSLVSAVAGKAQTVYNFEVEDYHTYFVGQGEVWVHNTCPKTLDADKQGKHIVGHNNYIIGRSILEADANDLLASLGTGSQVGSTDLGLPGSKERIDFGYVIGQHVDINGVSTPTTKAIAHYSSTGVHFVPSRP